MTISSSTFRKAFFTAALGILLVMPVAAFASVRITKVMYNPPGADVGHEWIQIANTGTSSITLSGYKLYEGGVNHKLTIATGTSTLQAGAVAVITTDPSQYQIDYPAFTGAIFKSSFSLSNMGETIELKDASLLVADSYTYTAPPVVKEVAPVKTAKIAKSATTTASLKKSPYTYAATNQVAAANAALPQLPAIPTKWLYVMGIFTLLLLGAAVVLYVRLSVTGTAAAEFELE